MIYMIMIIFTASVVCSLIFTPVVIKMAHAGGFVDRPDHQALKIHHTPVPNIGGAIIFLSTTLLISTYFKFYPVNRMEVLGILLPGTLVLILGIVDDRKNLGPKLRLLLQLGISIVLMLLGVKLNISNIAIFNYIATAIVVIGLINSINLLDGMDGLATGVSVICFMAFACLGMIQNNMLVIMFSLAAAGSLLGFLPYNFHVAKIFLGDGGSTFVGFILSALIISMAGESRGGAIYLLAGVTAVGLPVFDTGFAIVRRLKSNRNIFTGDREHFYDQLLKQGLSHRKTTAISYLITTVLSLASISIVYLWG